MELLHPFMPFITEEIWQKLPHVGESIMIAPYPVFDQTLVFSADEGRMNTLIGAIKAIRLRRAEMNVPPSRKTQLYIDTEATDIYSDQTAGFFMRLAFVGTVHIGTPVRLIRTRYNW